MRYKETGGRWPFQKKKQPGPLESQSESTSQEDVVAERTSIRAETKA